jgi:hypothetical protein
MKLSRPKMLKASFVVTTAAAAFSAWACGGQTSDSVSTTQAQAGNSGTSGNGGQSGSASGTGGVSGTAGTGTAGTSGTGTSGTAGTGTSGTAGTAGAGGTGTAGISGAGGNPAACPTTPPEPYVQCDHALFNGQLCTYTVDCQSGPGNQIAFTCSENGYWQIPQQACSNPYDSCPGTSINCWGGYWTIPEGTNPPPPCPEKKPVPGDVCTSFGFGPPTCGYPCEEGSGWTVGTCSYWAEPYWTFDGTCKSDCSNHDAHLLEFIQQNKQCEKPEDCQIIYPPCTLTQEHCSGAFYVNKNMDTAQYSMLTSELNACHMKKGGGEGCALCDGIPPPATCESNMCKPQTAPPSP